jgi:hypothetical protein
LFLPFLPSFLPASVPVAPHPPRSLYFLLVPPFTYFFSSLGYRNALQLSPSRLRCHPPQNRTISNPKQIGAHDQVGPQAVLQTQDRSSVHKVPEFVDRAVGRSKRYFRNDERCVMQEL